MVHFGHLVFIYSVVQIRSLDPVSSDFVSQQECKATTVYLSVKRVCMQLAVQLRVQIPLRANLRTFLATLPEAGLQDPGFVAGSQAGRSGSAGICLQIKMSSWVLSYLEMQLQLVVI